MRLSIGRQLRQGQDAIGRLGPRGWVIGAAVLVLLVIAAVVLVGWLVAPDGAPAASQISGGVPLPAPSAAAPTADEVAGRTVTPGLGLTIPATTAAAFAAIPPVTRVEPLADAADAALLERGNEIGALPRIAADGRRPWQAYARPFNRGDERPRLVLIIAGLGLSAAASEAAIQRLPGAVTLAFDPLAPAIAADVAAARRFGHETLTILPLEQQTFPFDDQGPEAIRAADPVAANLGRLDRVLAAAPTSVGVLAVGGSRFARAPETVRPLLARLKARGLMLVDATAAGGALAGEAGALEVPRVYVDLIVDEPADAASIDSRLAELETRARERLVAVGLGRPLPVTLARLRAWSETLDGRGLVLAPASAVVGSQFRDR